MTANRTAIALAAVLASMAPFAPRAWARGEARTVAVLGVSGPGGDALTEWLAESLQRNYKLVTSDQYRAEAERLRKRGPSPEEVSAVTWRLHVDAVIAGSVREERGRRVLRVVIRDGGTGEVVARPEEPVDRSSRLSPASQRRLLDAISAEVDTAFGAPRARPQESLSDLEGSADDEPSPTRRHDRRRAESDEPGPGYSDDDRPIGAPGERALDADRNVERRPQVRRRKRATSRATDEPSPFATEGLRIDVGFGLQRRTFDSDAAGATAYHGGPVPTVRVDGAVFPWAFNHEVARAHPALACFGVAVDVATALPFSSASPENMVVSGSARRFDAGVVARVPLRTKGDFALLLAAEYVESAYKSEDGGTLAVPDVDYRGLRQSVGLRIPLGTARFTLEVDGAIAAILDAGALSSATEYGAGSGVAGDARAALTVDITRWLYARAVAGYSMVSMSFQGGGARPASGTHDQLFDAALVVGYAAR